VPKLIFETNIQPSGLLLSFPDQDSPLSDTRQLASCLSLLRQWTKGEIAKGVLDTKTQSWLERTIDTEEEVRLKKLAGDLIVEYIKKETIKDMANTAEVISLVPVLGEDEFLLLLPYFLKKSTDDVHIPKVLAGLGQLIHDAPTNVLSLPNLVSILRKVNRRLTENTHNQKSVNGGELFNLTKALSIILDAMVTRKVAEVKKAELRDPLLKFLRSLQKYEDPYIKYYAAYAFQALLWVPDGESPWKGMARHAGMIISGVSGVVNAAKEINPKDFIENLKTIHEGCEGAIYTLGQLSEREEDIDTFFPSDGGTTRKRAWYVSLRGMDKCIEIGAFQDFKQLICNAPCRLEWEFQWGVCERLGNIVASSLWDPKTRVDAAKFLAHIYGNHADGERHITIMTYILDIFNRLRKEPFISRLPGEN